MRHAPDAAPDGSVFELLPAAFALLSTQGQVLQANALFRAMAGSAAERGAWLSPESAAALLTALAAPQSFTLELQAAASETWLACQGRWDAALAAHACLWQPIAGATLAAQQAMADQVAQFRLLADNVPAQIAFYETQGFRCQFANRAYASAFGLDPQSILGRTFPQVIGETAAALIQPSVDRVLQQATAVNYVRELHGQDGKPRWIEVSLLPHLDDDSKVAAVFVLINDITRHRLADAAVRESELRLAKFMHATVEGIVFHHEGIITDVNPPLCELLGYTQQELVGRHALGFVAEDELSKVGRVMAEQRELRYETAVVRRDGARIPVEFIVRTLERDGESLRMTIVRDIRDRIAAQARIHHLAQHDALTQLLNRASFMDRLEPALAHARAAAQPLALLFIDLDNFKRVNDSLGHLEGDKVLTTVAERISDCVRTTDLVARFGGDEFVVLLRDVRGREDVMVVLRALLSVVEVPVRADGRQLSVTPSIGVAMFPEHGDTAADLIQHADTAMYLAKAKGRANYQFFEPVLASRAYADLVLEAELAEALTHGQFRLYYQPQISAADGSLRGAEALLRWQHPTRGLLTPEAFIDVAERHRLMVPLGEWVMREAARQTRLWHKSGVAPVPIAVNLSAMQFRLSSFADTVADVLDAADVPGAWLELELTERMLMDDVEAAPATLASLRALGLSISVDDFGTGHTSLAHLTQLPLDKLKIDQGFVARLPGDEAAATITRAIVQMATGLRLAVIAEGVRTPQQRDLLASWGCDAFQGELISPPLSAQDFEAWLKSRPPR